MRRLTLAVVGVGFENKKGLPRRFEVAMCKPGEPVELVREPTNPADPRAIAVYSERGIQIGYVRAERAAFIGAAMRRGGVTAIFQNKEEWGASIRVHLDGTEPTLPQSGDSASNKVGNRASDDHWWPDEVWPDE